jgi:predicted aspartyl protease
VLGKKGVKEINGEFLGTKMRFLVDTGSSVSLIKRGYVEDRNLMDFVIPKKKTVTVANGHKLILSEKIEGSLTLQRSKVDASVYVVEALPVNALLGMDILQNFQALKLGGMSRSWW